VQLGDRNAAFTEDQFSATIQFGNGDWAGTSIGEDTATFVFQSN